MKKLVVVLFAAAGFVGVNAQNVSFGPVASVNHSWITGTSQSDRQFNLGYKVGAMLTYSIDPHWAVGADLLFANEGLRNENIVSDIKYTSKINLNYIRVPLKGTYFFGELGDKLRPKLYAGPSFGFLVGGKSKLETEVISTGNVVKTETNSKDNFKGFDLGAMVGAGLNYRIGTATWLNFDLNYTNGLIDISKSTSGWNANRNFGMALGVTFPLGTYTAAK